MLLLICRWWLPWCATADHCLPTFPQLVHWCLPVAMLLLICRWWLPWCATAGHCLPTFAQLVDWHIVCPCLHTTAHMLLHWWLACCCLGWPCLARSLCLQLHGMHGSLLLLVLELHLLLLLELHPGSILLLLQPSCCLLRGLHLHLPLWLGCKCFLLAWLAWHWLTPMCHLLAVCCSMLCLLAFHCCCVLG